MLPETSQGQQPPLAGRGAMASNAAQKAASSRIDNFLLHGKVQTPSPTHPVAGGVGPQGDEQRDRVETGPPQSLPIGQCRRDPFRDFVAPRFQ